MNITVQTNLERFQQALNDYIRLSRKTPEYCLRKQTAKLMWNIKSRLREIMPPKGSIRESILTRLRSGDSMPRRKGARPFIKIRPSAIKWVDSQGYVKNRQQELVRREIAIRESARGFLSVSARYNKAQFNIGNRWNAYNRQDRELSVAELQTPLYDTSMIIEWSRRIDELSEHAAEGLVAEKGQQQINKGIDETIDDINIYLLRKINEVLKQVGLQ
jgi:hypothetical protein